MTNQMEFAPIADPMSSMSLRTEKPESHHEGVHYVPSSKVQSKWTSLTSFPSNSFIRHSKSSGTPRMYNTQPTKPKSFGSVHEFNTTTANDNDKQMMNDFVRPHSLADLDKENRDKVEEEENNKNSNGEEEPIWRNFPNPKVMMESSSSITSSTSATSISAMDPAGASANSRSSAGAGDSRRRSSVQKDVSSSGMHRSDSAMFLDEVSLLLLEDIHSENHRVVMKTLERLADVCSQSNDECSQACHMGAPVAAVTIMKKWSDHKVIQAKCIKLMIALTMGLEGDSVQKTLWMMGGMESVMIAMRTFQDSRSVQFFGCNAILSLLPSSNQVEENIKFTKWMGRRFVADLQGVKAVISGMIQFEDDRKLQEAGCSVLLKLATFMHSGKDRQMLLQSGAVSAFSVALESHANDENIHQFTTMFMNLLSGGV